MAKITYQHKVALNPLPGIPAENKVMDIDMNEIKASVNALYDCEFINSVNGAPDSTIDVGLIINYQGQNYELKAQIV